MTKLLQKPKVRSLSATKSPVVWSTEDLTDLLGKWGPGCRIHELIDPIDQTFVRLDQLRLANVVLPTEKGILGTIRLQRLVEKGIQCAGLNLLQKVWVSKTHLPETWKQQHDGYPRTVFFDNSIITSKELGVFILGVVWDHAAWRIQAKLISAYFYPEDLSLVL